VEIGRISVLVRPISRSAPYVPARAPEQAGFALLIAHLRMAISSRF
jgi:hypothetical protein